MSYCILGVRWVGGWMGGKDKEDVPLPPKI